MAIEAPGLRPLLGASPQPPMRVLRDLCAAPSPVRCAPHVRAYTCTLNRSARGFYNSTLHLQRARPLMSLPADLVEALSVAPGSVKLFVATSQNPDVEGAMRNLSELASRMEHARKAGCWIEAISLRLQYQDMWLRTYFENSGPKEERQREFGRLLRQCFEQGLHKALYDRLARFNKARIQAIHGFMVGSIAYGDLQTVVTDSDGLSEDLAEFVLLNSGQVVTLQDLEGRHANRGDQIFHLPSCIEHLRGRGPML